MLVLSRAIARWMVEHPGQRPDVRELKHCAVAYDDQAEVRSDPPGMFAPDVFVLARAAEDFIVCSVNSTTSGVVFRVMNVSLSMMPRRFDGWLIGRAADDLAVARRRVRGLL